MMNIIFMATMYPTMLILGLVFRNYMKPKSSMQYGIHLPAELVGGEEMEKVDDSFKKSFRTVMLFLIIVPPFFFFLKHFSLQFTAWMIWFMGGIAALNIPYIRANKTTIELKEACLKAKGEVLPAMENITDTTQYFETGIVRTLKPAEFVPPVVITAVAVLVMFFAGQLFGFDEKTLDVFEVYRWTVLVFALMTPLFLWLAQRMDSMRAVVISHDSSVNMAYNRAKKHIWTRAWRDEAWVNTVAVCVITAGALVQKRSFLVFLAAAIMETVVGIVIMVRASNEAREVEQLYHERKEKLFDPDDDRYWVWGMLYNNPYDKRTMVDKRFGVGTTVNMATKTGKVMIGITIASLVWIPFMCIWMIMEEFTPIHLKVDDNTVICEHLKTDYEIPVSEIKEIEMLDELPEHRSKVSGTATDQFEKGKFSNRELGKYYTFAYCENQVFIKLVTDDKIYIVSGSDDAETTEVFEELQQRGMFLNE